MSKNTLFLPRNIVNKLLHHAQSEPDQEICGLIGAHNNRPTHCYPFKNCAEQPQQNYLLDAEEQITAMKTMRDHNQDLFAIYHSHPHSEAYPSLKDQEMAAYPDCYYLIISLNTKGVLQLRAFKLHGQTAAEEFELLLEH